MLGIGTAFAFACSSNGDTTDGGTNDGANGDVTINDAGGDTNVIATGLSKVGTGEYETLYLIDGVVYGYGAGAGLLGQGSYQGICIPPRPIVVPQGLKFIDVQGGLHQSEAVDQNGHVWTWGQPSSGLQGSGVDGGVSDGTTPYMITVDAKGAAFDHVVSVVPTTSFDSALKDDGTVWVWGDCTNGVAGDGTISGVIEAPTQVPIPLPSGVKITKIVGSSQMIALASDGSVWTWGPSENGYLGTGSMKASDAYTPAKVIAIPSDIVDVAIGYASFQYALTKEGVLWGWGYRGAYLGLGSADAGAYFPTATPLALDAVLGLPHPVASVSCDFSTTHVILTDGSLWGWGDDAQGEVGDGKELDFSKTTPPYAWDYGQFDLGVWKPVRIVPTVSNFTKIFSNSAYDFYDYAQTADGKLYSWGRNKTGTLGNCVYPLNGNPGVSADMAATYPNSWDQPTPTLVDPMSCTPKGVNSPYCVAYPDAASCF